MRDLVRHHLDPDVQTQQVVQFWMEHETFAVCAPRELLPGYEEGKGSIHHE